ncbi:MAG: acetate--CoA ligase family protein [Aigarchaeota archaeon]|nr:acetate--CoA ligase family protein [Aigarchaeota archaeon]
MGKALLLLEHEAKKIASDVGIPVPSSQLCTSAQQCVEAAKDLGFPVMLKAQLPIKERLKHGGILKAGNDEEVAFLSRDMFSKRIQGLPVTKVLLEKAVPFTKEFYMAYTFDWRKQRPIFMFSTAGGAGLEERAGTGGVLVLEAEQLEASFEETFVTKTEERGLAERGARQLLRIARCMKKLFDDYHAETVEINPLSMDEKGELTALDVRVIIDNDALSTQKELRQKLATTLQRPELEKQMVRENLVQLEGDVGVIGNGAGLVLSTMDLVKLNGGEPADFLDLGGGATRDNVVQALKRLSKIQPLRCIVINVLGGITRCDEIAQGIAESVKTLQLPALYVRLVGTNEEQGKQILREAGISYFENMEDLVTSAVRG